MMKILLQLQKNKILALVLISAFFISCDFSPRLHKKILEAQEYIKRQQYSKAISQYKEILKNNPPPDIKVKINYQLGELIGTAGVEITYEETLRGTKGVKYIQRDRFNKEIGFFLIIRSFTSLI